MLQKNEFQDICDNIDEEHDALGWIQIYCRFFYFPNIKLLIPNKKLLRFLAESLLPPFSAQISSFNVLRPAFCCTSDPDSLNLFMFILFYPISSQQSDKKYL